jgi:hypothetical protein
MLHVRWRLYSRQHFRRSKTATGQVQGRRFSLRQVAAELAGYGFCAASPLLLGDRLDAGRRSPLEARRLPGRGRLVNCLANSGADPGTPREAEARTAKTRQD